jgi:hypothetical protein
VKCPTCSGRFAERFEELDSLGNWLQVLRCINGHRFDRLKPLPALRVAPLTAPVVAPVYVRQQKKRAECLGCGREMAIQSRGLCGRCLYHEIKAEKESVSMGRKQIRKSAVCRGCEVEKTIMGKGLCGSCYSRERSAEKRAAKASARPLVQQPKAFAFGGPTSPMADEERMAVADMAPAVAPASTFVADLDCVLFELRSMLLAKNAAYGDSALNPVRVFSQADPVEQLRVRIDDKISRLMRGAACGEDTVGDLMGYLVLLKIAEGRS